MPIYEYRCLDCGHQFELMQKFSDPPAETCTSCSGTVQKLISRSAFHLKGSGWYVTDYGRNGSANGKATDKNDSESSTENSDKKSTSESSGAANTTSASTESTKNATTSSAA
ncbi:MAG TPA: zinc ribbon domain-containing protein [Ktedonobacteraceae bacterium]